MEQNSPLLDEYHSIYTSGHEIPVAIFNQEKNFSTDIKVLKNIRPSLDELDHNPVPLIDGSSNDFKDLDLLSLPGYPEIWHQNKIAIKTGPVGDSELLKNLLLDEDLSAVLKNKDYTSIESVVVDISGKDIEFDNAILVTLFLLPCTIGPYVIAAGILSVFDMLANIPVLIVYNLIFILPMMAIVGIVYLGLRGVKDVEEWKNRHITKLHLVAGILMLFVGVALLMGWV